MGAWVQPSQILAALTIIVVFLGVRIVLKRPAASFAVVVPLALLTPWEVTISPWDYGITLPPAAAALWTWWLANERPEGRPFAKSGFVYWAVVAFGATTAVVFAPQMLVPLTLVAAYYLIRGRGRTGWAQFVALLVVPTVYKAITIAPAVMSQGAAWNVKEWFEDTIGYGWDLRPWFESASGGLFRGNAAMDAIFYVPLLLPFVVVSLAYRKEWWYLPTFLWGGTLVAANVFLGANYYLQYSTEMQMGLLVPFGIVGVLKWRESVQDTRDNEDAGSAGAE
jgi:hypothetical protein